MTRREFLALLGAGASGAVPGTRLRAGSADGPRLTSTAPTSAPATPRTVRAHKSLVAQVRSKRVMAGRRIHRVTLDEMIGLGLRHVTDKDNVNDAWHELLADDDVIGLKFNRSGAEQLGTTEPVAELLVNSLTKAGWAPEQIVLIEATPHVAASLKTQPRREGWRSEVTHFGSGEDRLAAVLDQVTAIINVPFLKANPIAGMSGCLKNLSHALVKHPAYYHANAKSDPKRGVLKPGRYASPYVGDIVAAPPIRDKLRLHIVNALRTCRESRIDPSGSTIDSHGGLLVGRDPVAVDMIGLRILNGQRTACELAPLTKPEQPLPQLRAATDAGLGVWQLDFIEHLTIRT